MHQDINYLSLFAVVAAALIAPCANALSVPTMPSVSSYDEVRLPDGSYCRSSDYGTQLQVGVVGGQGSTGSRNGYDDRYYGHEDRRTDEAGVFAQIIIPIGGPERIDCSKVYELMVKQKTLELTELEIRIRDAESRLKLAEMNLPSFKDQ